MDNGRILYGGVGSGKSITALAYYMKKESPKDVYVITTAKKRDSLEWEGDAAQLGIGRTSEDSLGGVLKVDSWNNIGRYVDTTDAFFIFDEQRLVGHGAWVKSFLKIVRANRWILLTATPGDSWSDYAPVFIANGWYRNITDFRSQHVVYAPRVRYPLILRYVGEQRLERLRNRILVEMNYSPHTERSMNYLDVGHDRDLLVRVQKERWNYHEDRPLIDVADMWRYMRKIINTHPSRIEMVRFLRTMHQRLIVFYNFNYELEILRELGDTSEWNGHRHDPLPEGDSWTYLVQYTAGSEGWNCVSTNAMCFYSLTYSYKNFRQSLGRIDRLNTNYPILYYYVLKSGAYIDRKILDSLDHKKDFNERNALKVWGTPEFSYE